jgi:hypothetical protein
MPGLKPNSKAHLKIPPALSWRNAHFYRHHTESNPLACYDQDLKASSLALPHVLMLYASGLSRFYSV